LPDKLKTVLIKKRNSLKTKQHVPGLPNKWR